MGSEGVCFSCPGRIDLAGGTLDVPPLCFLVPKATTVNLAVDLRVFVGVRQTGSVDAVRRDGGEAQPVGEGSLFAHALAHFHPGAAVEIGVRTQIPRSAGLGGSSALLVALCRALGAMGGGEPDARGLLDVVTVLEHRTLGKPAGTQDGIAAINGGLQVITFSKGRPEWRAIEPCGFLNQALFLVHDPTEHHSGLNNWGIIKRVCDGERRLRETLREMARNAAGVAEALQSRDEAGVIEGLRREAQLRGTLAPGLVPRAMRELLKELGDGVVGKICGAGGGGCMWVTGPGLDATELTHAARRHDLNVMQVHAEPMGVRREDQP